LRIGLVGCVKKKGPMAAPGRRPVRVVIVMGRRRFVEASCDRWFILSALHGPVDPDEVIAPYDESLVASRNGNASAADRPSTGGGCTDDRRRMHRRPASGPPIISGRSVTDRPATR
jgi:hypothetical protein